MFEFFKSKSKENIFWDWFVKNKLDIEKFIDSDHSDYTIYKALTNKIKSYNDILYPELTKTEDNFYVLIITPDGVKEGVEPTKKLGATCPGIDNWIVKKFRQPSDKIALNFNGLEYPSSDIEIMHKLNSEKEKFDIAVFIRNMNLDVERYKSLAFLYLDHILGEFNTITKIGFIDFYNLDEDKTVKDSISILELRRLIEKELY